MPLRVALCSVEMSSADAERLAAHLVGRCIWAPSGCLLWTGARMAFGHGQVRRQGRKWFAHRLLWVLKRGPIPAGQIVRHKCDVPHCLNLDHLLLGSMRDNGKDMRERGRSAKGERHSQATLTEAQAIAVIQDARNHAEIARSYGVVRNTVSRIKSGERWPHLQAYRV